MLKAAEIIDAYRLFPRITLIAFILSVGITMQWYFDFPNQYIIECNADLFTNLIDRNIPLKDAESIACKAVGVIDRPTGYTALTSVLIGASAGVFGFYANTGRVWGVDQNTSNRNRYPKSRRVPARQRTYRDEIDSGEYRDGYGGSDHENNRDA